MDRRPWLERVADALERRGLPAPARERLLAELRDHLEDLNEEGRGMDVETQVEARMGRPDELAAAAASEHRRAGWACRHPLLVFGLAPLPAAAVALAGCGLAFGLPAAALAGDIPRPTLVWGVVAASYALRYLPFALAAAGLGLLAARCRAGRAWAAVAVGQVALLAGTAVSRVALSDAPGESTWEIGFAWPVEDGGLTMLGLPPSWWQLPQLIAPAAAAWAAMAWARRRASRVA